MSDQEQNDLLADAAAQFEGDDTEFGTRSGRKQLPAGKAVLKIENVYLNRSQNKGRLQLNASCKVLQHTDGADHVGASYIKQWGLESAQNMEWLNGDMSSLEIEGVKKSSLKDDLARIRTELAEVVFRCQFADNSNGQWPPTCYINPPARVHDTESLTASGNPGF